MYELELAAALVLREPIVQCGLLLAGTAFGLLVAISVFLEAKS